ncbi:hypothetical protein Mal35_40570 [Gimesia maris]|nr:hypothetical protein Mal35_40570 [Gimesia maris]
MQTRMVKILSWHRNRNKPLPVSNQVNQQEREDTQLRNLAFRFDIFSLYFATVD